MTILLIPIRRATGVEVRSQGDEAGIPMQGLETRFSYPIPCEMRLQEEGLSRKRRIDILVPPRNVLLQEGRSVLRIIVDVSEAGINAHQISFTLASHIIQSHHLVYACLFQQRLQPSRVVTFDLLGIYSRPRAREAW
jgi:hypothetical protein